MLNTHEAQRTSRFMRDDKLETVERTPHEHVNNPIKNWESLRQNPEFVKDPWNWARHEALKVLTNNPAIVGEIMSNKVQEPMVCAHCGKPILSNESFELGSIKFLPQNSAKAKVLFYHKNECYMASGQSGQQQ